MGLRDWDQGLRPDCIPHLLGTVAGENEYVWRHGGQVLSEFPPEATKLLKDALLGLLRRPRSVDTAHAALFALGRGWSRDADVGAIAERLRESVHVGIRTDAIRIRAERDEADLSDLAIFAPIAFNRERAFSSDVFAPDLVRYFGTRHRAEVLGYIEGALSDGARHNQMSLVGSLIAVDPDAPAD